MAELGNGHRQALRIKNFKNWIKNYLNEHKDLMETDLAAHINEGLNLISESVQKKDIYIMD